MGQLQQGFTAGEMGFLHSSIPKPLMSALGQKQTLRRVCAMSALPPKADMVQQDRNVRFVPKADIPGRFPSDTLSVRWQKPIEDYRQPFCTRT